ncbi:winged helix-turn-helix domain-containing protein [Oxalobacter formigenes]|uniref:winged helix-turn-helix domain-containing protein n=1 Tax=Oxalobacter formigenes TaxID=847 RepID=UPI00241CE767|nr:winged helix-turn-helix domain-containing protein [Oxalobacter formigenes]
MKVKRDIKKEIIDALKEKPATVKELAEKTGFCSQTINKHVRKIRVEKRKNGTVYVADWLEGDYAFSRVFAFGVGKDAPTPNRKVAGPKKRKPVLQLSPEPLRIKTSWEVIFRCEFLDNLMFRVVAGRCAAC